MGAPRGPMGSHPAARLGGLRRPRALREAHRKTAPSATTSGSASPAPPGTTARAANRRCAVSSAAPPTSRWSHERHRRSGRDMDRRSSRDGRQPVAGSGLVGPACWSVPYSLFPALRPWAALRWLPVEGGVEDGKGLLHHLGLALDQDQLHGSLDGVLVRTLEPSPDGWWRCRQPASPSPGPRAGWCRRRSARACRGR